jgi:2-oxoacid:acceptor oxidoreductase delta subunit (pyruvate/2-ketoisovalerate family)
MAMKKEFTTKYESSWSDADELLLHLNTGSWRTARPVVDNEKCIYCGTCVLFCPPQCMRAEDENVEPDLEYCKGCGICARECPRKAITMEPEG